MKFTFGQVCVCAGLIAVGAFALSAMPIDWSRTDEGCAGVIARVVAAATHRFADDAERVSSHAAPPEARPGD